MLQFLAVASLVESFYEGRVSLEARNIGRVLRMVREAEGCAIPLGNDIEDFIRDVPGDGSRNRITLLAVTHSVTASSHRKGRSLVTTERASIFRAQAEPETTVVCVDPRRRWSQAGNVWHNAGIRSTLHMMSAPLRWPGKMMRRNHS